MFTASSSFFIMKLHLNLSLRQALLAAMAAVAALAPTVSAGIVETRYDLQYYLDFSRNAGAFSAGATNVTVGYRDGSATYTIPVMPYVGSYAQAVDRSFAAVGAIVSYGGSSLVSSQFMYGAAHVFDRFSNIFAKGQMGFSFNDENGNAYSGDIYGAVNVDRFGHDGAISRTDKLVTAVAYTPMASDAFMSTLDSSTWLYRLGNGGYWNTNAAIISTGSNAIGGIIDMDSYSRQTNGDWHMKGIFRDDQSTPLDTGVYEGDSGSPLYAWDEGNNRFVYVGALWASNLHKGFGNDVYARYNPTLAQAAMAQYTINATFSGADTIAWSASDAATGKGTLTQGEDIINYIGKGSENTMGATKGISFATDSDRQQVLQLQGNVNMGAGALTFTKGDWKITEAADYTLSSAGFEVLMGASLTWELTGTSSEEIRKVGEGTMTIAGSGNNEAALVVGGGYAIVPAAEHEFTRKRKLLNEVELLDMMAIIQSLPGIIAGNAALYIGYRCAGIIGALSALLGVATPSTIIILLIAIFLRNVDLNIPSVQGAFIGAQAAITGLITLTLINMVRKTVKNSFALILAVASAAATIIFSVSPVWVILSGGVLGIAYKSAGKKAPEKAGEK